jgi:FkbM family methyltransferase
LRELLKKMYLRWLYRNCPGYIKFLGNKFYLDDGDSLRLYRNGTYSQYLIDVCREYMPKDNGVFVDAGASIGWFAVNLACNDSQSHRVIAIEPNKDQYSTLFHNCKPYFNNVTVMNMALWSMDGRRELYIDPNNGSGGKLYVTDDRPTQSIQTVTLDTALKMANVKRVNVLKIDCEGAEGHIIQGFMRMEVLRPVIVLEFTPQAMFQAGSSPVKMWQRLFKYGNVFYLDEERCEKIECQHGQSLREGNYLVVPK